MLWEADGPRASEAVLGQLRARLESARKMLVAVTEQLQAPARPGPAPRRPPRAGFGFLGPAPACMPIAETCPVSTEGGPRRVHLVRKEGRDVST